MSLDFYKVPLIVSEGKEFYFDVKADKKLGTSFNVTLFTSTNTQVAGWAQGR